MATARLHPGLDPFPAILADPTIQAAVRAKPNVHPVAAAAAAAHAAAAAARAAAGGGAPSPAPGQQAWTPRSQSGGAATRKKRSNAEVQDTDWAVAAAAGGGDGSKGAGSGAKPKKGPKTPRGGATGAGAGFGPGPAAAPWLPGPTSSLSGGSSATLGSPGSAMHWQAAAAAAAAAAGGGRGRPHGLGSLGVLFPPGFPGCPPPVSLAMPSPAGSASQPWMGSPSVTGLTSATRASGFHQSADSALRPPPQHLMGMPPGMPAGMYADLQQLQHIQQQFQPVQQQQQQQHRPPQLSNGTTAGAGAGAGGVPARPTTPALHPMAVPVPAAPGGEMEELWASIGTSQPMAAGLDIQQHLDDPVLMELYMKELPIAQALGAARGPSTSSAAHSGPPAAAAAAVGSPTSISGGGPATSGSMQVTAAAGGERGLERHASVTGGSGLGLNSAADTAAELGMLPDLTHQDDDDHHLDDDWLLHLAADHPLGDMSDMAAFEQEHGRHHGAPNSTLAASAGPGAAAAASARAAAAARAGLGHAASCPGEGLQVVAAAGEGFPLRPLVTEGSINSCEPGSFKAASAAAAAGAGGSGGGSGGPTSAGSSGVSPGTPSKQGAAAGSPSSPTSATMRSATGYAGGVLPDQLQRGELHEVTSAGCLPQLLQGPGAHHHAAAAGGVPVVTQASHPGGALQNGSAAAAGGMRHHLMGPGGLLLQGGSAAAPTNSQQLAEGLGGLGLAGQPSVSTSGLPPLQQPQMLGLPAAGPVHMGMLRPPVPPAYVPALVDVLHHPDLTGASPLATAVVAAALGGPTAVAAAVGGRGPLAAAAAGARLAPGVGPAAAGQRPQAAKAPEAGPGMSLSSGHMPGFDGTQQRPRGPALPGPTFHGLPGLQNPALTHMVFSAAMGGVYPGQSAQHSGLQQPSGNSSVQAWGSSVGNCSSNGRSSGHVSVPDAHQLLGSLVQAVRPLGAPMLQPSPNAAAAAAGGGSAAPGMLGPSDERGQSQGMSAALHPTGAAHAQQPSRAAELPAAWQQPGALEALMSDPRVAESAKAAAAVSAQMAAGGGMGAMQHAWGLPGHGARA